MKKALFILVAVAALCCSCSSKKCKCTVTVDGESVTEEFENESSKKCSDFNTEVEAFGIKTSTKCVPTM